MKENITLDTGTVTIKVSESVELLDLVIHQTLKWKEHLVNGSLSLLSTLARRLSAVKMTSRNAVLRID